MPRHLLTALACVLTAITAGSAPAAQPRIGTTLISFLSEGGEYGGWLERGPGESPLAFAFQRGPTKLFLGERTQAGHITGLQVLELPVNRIMTWHAADLDGDGLEDLIAASASPPLLFVFRQRSTRTLELTSTIDLPDVSWPFVWLDSGDVNGDGFTDIVFTRSTRAGVCFGDETGALDPPVLLPPTSDTQGTVSLAKVGDAPGESIFIVRGTNIDVMRYADGQFSLLQRIPTSRHAEYLRAGPWRDQNRTGLLAVGRGPGRTTVETFSFEEGAFVQDGHREYLGYTFEQIRTADIDGDGRLDIAFNGALTGVYFGEDTPDGTLPFADTPTLLGLGIKGVNFDAAPRPGLTDLDGDGLPDFVLWNSLWNGDGFRVIYGGADRFAKSIVSVKLPEIGPITIGAYPSGMHDDPSFFGTRGDHQPAFRFRLHETDHQTRRLVYDEDPLLSGPTSTAYQFVDANSDGLLDLLSVSRYPANLFSYRYGTPSGTFAQPITADTPHFILEKFLTGDMDGDGNLDIVAFSSSNNRAVVCFGEESGVLAEPVILDISSSSTSGFAHGVGDVTGNARDDFVFLDSVNTAWDRLKIFSYGENRELIDTKTVFGPTMMFPQDRRLLVSDLNGDGIADILVPTTSSLVYFESTGPGSFAPPRSLDLLSRARLIRTADLNADGFPEIIVTTQKGLEIHGFDTDRNFVPLARTTQFADATDILVVDLDADGLLDLVVFEDGIISAVFGTGRRGCRADFARDGRLDFFDVVRFMNDFQAGNRFADLVPDGVFDFFDIAAFLRYFNEGCP